MSLASVNIAPQFYVAVVKVHAASHLDVAAYFMFSDNAVVLFGNGGIACPA